MPVNKGKHKFAAINWATWQPHQQATLLFVIHDGRILLIRKKRGLGSGKITGPGGRIEPGETISQCAKRELQEEVGMTAHETQLCGDLWFQFTNGFALKVYVLLCQNASGEPIETDEAFPIWYPIHTIPFEEMWEDDHLWIPWMLAGTHFSGRFLFDNESLLGHMFI